MFLYTETSEIMQEIGELWSVCPLFQESVLMTKLTQISFKIY